MTIMKRSHDPHYLSCDLKGGSCDPPTHIENVKKDAPMVGLTLRENVLPTCLRTRDVLPTPARHVHHIHMYSCTMYVNLYTGILSTC